MHEMPEWKYLSADGVSLFVFINDNFDMDRLHSAFKLMEVICFWLCNQFICCIL